MTVFLFITAIIIFLTVDYFIQRSKRAQKVPIPVRPASMRFPEGIFFTKNHTWLNLFPSGVLQLGLDDFLLRIFQSPHVRLLKRENELVAKGEPIVTLYEGERSVTVRSPIEGTVTLMNEHLSNASMKLSGLFNEGWLYTIQPKRSKDITEFFLGKETKRWIQKELGRLRDFLAQDVAAPTPAMVVLQDGGEPMPGILSGVENTVVQHFEEQFLTTI